MSTNFGWSYPAGCPSLPWDGNDDLCHVCGRYVGDPVYSGDCICQPCPVCGEVGDPDCYKNHGMQLSQAQIEAIAEAEKRVAEEAKSEYEYERQIAEAEAIMEGVSPSGGGDY